MYDMPHIEKFMDVKSLLSKLVAELEKHTHTVIRHFSTGQDGSSLYVIGDMGVLSLTLDDVFGIKGLFTSESTAEKFKIGLSNAIKHALPREITDEMRETLTIFQSP
jgi:hypothetical protein